MKRISKKQIRVIKDNIRDSNCPFFFIEGFRMLDSLSNYSQILYTIVSESVLSDDSRKNTVEEINRHTDVYIAGSHSFDHLSTLRSPDGILYCIKKPDWSIERFFQKPSIGLLLDNVQDPGNLGTIIRSSYAFDIDGIFLYGEHCSPFNMKCIRASAGMILNVPVFLHGEFCLEDFTKNCFNVSMASKDKEGKNIVNKVFSPCSIIAFGNEGHGFSREIIEIACDSFFIPVHKGLDSLNLASSVAITLFYLNKIQANIVINT